MATKFLFDERGKQLTGKISEAFQAASNFLNKNRQSPKDEKSQRVLLGLYRLLSAGNPLSLDDVAALLDVPRKTVTEALGKIPNSSVEYDADGRIVGFVGQTLNKTRHQLRIDGRILHTWCAFDTLFAPGLLGKGVEISSGCPVSGANIRLTVEPQGVRETAPSTTLLSFVTPNADEYNFDVRSAFCCHVKFLGSEAAATRWAEANEGALFLTIAEGFELGRIRNGTRFSEMLFS